MLNEQEKKDILALIKQQVVPAIGCTEPMAVALCVAKAKEVLGKVPEKINLSLSANILKNAMGVGIPGTGMIGLPIAVALGALIGDASLQLEVLRNCDEEAVKRGKQYIDENRINIKLEKEDKDKLYIKVICCADNDTVETVIKGTHTNFIHIRKNDKVLLNKKACAAAVVETSGMKLSLRKVYEFATQTDVKELEFILEGRDINKKASDFGMKNKYGHSVGQTMSSSLGKEILGDSIFGKIIAKTSSACDARMGGAMIPVMSNSGSGNQGVCVTMPVIVFAEENKNTREELIRGLIISNLTAIYIKQSLGTLSALCGCVVAGTGSSCGITYLMGGTYEQISYSVKNMIANLTGMVCDGAKPSCALKLTTGAGTAVLSAMLSMQQKFVTSAEGIIDDDVDKTIQNLSSIGREGMDVTDHFVLDIMTNKSK